MQQSYRPAGQTEAGEVKLKAGDTKTVTTGQKSQDSISLFNEETN